MVGEGASSSFKDGRTTLRDTAKWMTSGIFGIAALIVGSSTISQLGSMDPTTSRFKLAVGCLIVASGLCWLPFRKAVSVLRSDVMSLQQFVDAPSGELKNAADSVTKLLGMTLPGTQANELVSMRVFAGEFHVIRRVAWEAAPNDKDSTDKAVSYIDDFRNICRDACITELIVGRFNRLMSTLEVTGPMILLLFLTATWAANPAKDDGTLAEKPRLETLDLAQIASLNAAKIPQSCLGPGARLVAISKPESRLQTVILIPPEKAASTCEARKLMQIDGKTINIDE